MDPVTAVGLASSIVQLLTFANGLLHKSKEIYRSADGATDIGNDLEIVARTLSELSTEILTKQRNAFDSRLFFKNDKTEKELRQLCERSVEVSASLMAALDKMKQGGNDTHWRSFRQALRFVWNENKINTLAAQIEQYRRQIDTTLLVSLRKKLDRLGSDPLPITEITASQQSRQADLVESVHKNKWRPDLQEDLKSFSARFSELTTEQRSCVITGRILDVIRFGELNDRYMAIPEAYCKTFEWAFLECDLASTRTPTTPRLMNKDNFVNWLRTENPLYWITGKPGSGKSTLMKYLYQHENLGSNLQHWHLDKPLVIASFFFWNSGTQIQMSQVGLLRTLLYQIFDKNRKLLPLAFPKRWELYELIGGDDDPLSWTELTTAINNIVNDTSRCYCFFIDGLDEFDGDPAVLAQFIMELSCHKNVKVCASSRPWLVFEEAFSSGPWLRLESLTYNDISFFVNDKMGQSKMFAKIQSFLPETAVSLIHEITERASGVFLWVHIVVNSLIEGLRDGDTVEELYERLRALPSDLEELFRRILHRLNPFHFKQSCEAFLLHKAAGLPITLLDLALAKDGCEKALRAPIRAFTEQELEYYSENMRRFLNSRCKGLLEAPDVASKKHEAKVQYLHRTVRDFFQQETVMEYIKSGVLETFDPVLQLSAAYLARIKSIEPRPSAVMVNEFWCAFLKAVWNAKQIERSKTHEMFLNQLDETSTNFWKQMIRWSGLKYCLQQVVSWQWPSEQARHSNSLEAEATGQIETKFWGNTHSYMSSNLDDLIDSAKGPKQWRTPISSFFELALQLNLDRYVISRLESDIPITYTFNNQTLFEVCHSLGYSELEEYLIKRKSPGSKKPKKSESNELKSTGDGKSGDFHTKWFKRLSLRKTPTRSENPVLNINPRLSLL